MPHTENVANLQNELVENTECNKPLTSLERATILNN